MAHYAQTLSSSAPVDLGSHRETPAETRGDGPNEAEAATPYYGHAHPHIRDALIMCQSYLISVCPST